MTQDERERIAGIIGRIRESIRTHRRNIRLGIGMVTQAQIDHLVSRVRLLKGQLDADAFDKVVTR